METLLARKHAPNPHATTQARVIPALLAGQYDYHVSFADHFDSVQASAVPQPAYSGHAAEEVFYASGRAAVGFRATCVSLVGHDVHSASSGGSAHGNRFVYHLVEPSPAALEPDRGLAAVMQHEEVVPDLAIDHFASL